MFSCLALDLLDIIRTRQTPGAQGVVMKVVGGMLIPSEALLPFPSFHPAIQFLLWAVCMPGGAQFTAGLGVFGTPLAVMKAGDVLNASLLVVTLLSVWIRRHHTRKRVA